MKKIKILMVLGSTNMGGAQMFVLNLIKNLNLNRFQVDFVVNFPERDGGIGQELKGYECNIYMLPYFKVYNYFSFAKAWKQFLTEHHYDIVHGHSTNSAAVYLRIAKEMGCKTIAHCHSAGFRGGRIQQLMKGFFTKGICKVSDYWFACSAKAAEHLYGEGYMAYPRYYNIPNAINVEQYLYDESISKRIRKEIGVGGDVFLCGHVGSFTIPKNHPFLLEIFKEVLKLKPNAKLICCGSGSLMPQVKEKAKELGIDDKVLYPGVIKNCNEYMMAMDVLIFPSLFEGFPVTVIEAEATGLPVVMSDVITKEVDITNSIHRLSLSDSPQVWAKEVCGSDISNRKRYNISVADSKYNMRSSAKMIMSLYDEMVNKNTIQ